MFRARITTKLCPMQTKIADEGLVGLEKVLEERKAGQAPPVSV